MPLDDFAILHLAREAVAHTRRRLWDRSENKGYAARYRNERAKYYSEDKVKTRSDKYDQLKRLKPPARLLSHTETLSYEKEIVKLGVGNNYEYAVVAYTYLYSRLIDFTTPLDIINLTGDFFVVINQSLSGSTYHASCGFKYPPSFSDWSPRAVFCNAWANLVTHPCDYTLQWKAKMDKWDACGKQINGQNPATNYWYSEPDVFIKRSAIDRNRP